MGVVFDHTKSLLLPSVSATLSTFLCNPNCKLTEKLKYETRVRISQKKTDNGDNFEFSGSFVDIIRANEIIHTFIQQLNKNINDSLCETSTLMLDLNEKQKSLLVHGEERTHVVGSGGLICNPDSKLKDEPKIDSDISGLETLMCENVVIDPDPSEENDHDEQGVNSIPDLSSDYNAEEGSSERELVQDYYKAEEYGNNSPLTGDMNIQQETSLSNPGSKKKEKQNNQHTLKVDFNHPDVDMEKKKAGRVIRDRVDPDEAKSECRFCSYENFSTYALAKKRLQQHFCRNHANTDPVHKCDLCPRSFCTHAQLYNHKRAKHIFKKCETCGIVVNKSYYPKHIKLHEDGGNAYKFECQICNKKLASKLVLEGHMKRMHMSKEERETFSCEICKKCWLNKTSLDRHMKIYHGDGNITKLHLCDICGKGFETASKVKSHKQTHDEIPQFVCNVCYKAFRCKDGLRSHMKTHTGVKNHLCMECGKAFTQSGALDRHKRIHTGERPFVCGLCDSSFNDSSILRRHIVLKHKKENV
ncbi:KRAB [Mytilus edulis]|uniref:KRAB n=1 Tax=Mytilus edulis TaxID=6550 RepID=A0A8S3USP8_MYTED|nr:KRAB [Mytilus edulis]